MKDEIPKLGRFDSDSKTTASEFGVEPLVRQKIADIEEKYNELIMAVERKFMDETRHQTALRYIKESEQFENNVAKNSDSNFTA